VSRVTAFEFAITPLIVFGSGTLARLGELAARLGRRAYLVTGRSALARAGTTERIEELLRARRVSVASRQAVGGEPDTTVVDQGCRSAREAGCDLVVGVGGGSVLDAAKAIAGLLTNGGEALDYLEVVGRGRKLERPAAPFVAVPTTAGTGSEVTKNAVLADPATGTKASIRHEHLLPRVALLDPELTRTLPPEVTAGSGLDALIQLVEPYVSRRDHPLIDALALPGIRRAASALPRAYADGNDAEARADMMLAANWSGMALAHCGLGAAHAFSGPLGGSFPIAHGMACAATIPYVISANLRVAERTPGGDRTIRRYAEVARAMGLREGRTEIETARGAGERMWELCREMKVPTLGAIGVTREAFPDLVRRAMRTSSMKANPVDLGEEDLIWILERAMG
jgi:alcohol dehydrogenase class IV